MKTHSNGINGVLNSAIGYIWTTAANDDDRMSPPDYWFSFARSNRTKLGGILSKDVTQSYTKRTVRPAPQFAPHQIGETMPVRPSDDDPEVRKLPYMELVRLQLERKLDAAACLSQEMSAECLADFHSVKGSA